MFMLNQVYLPYELPQVLSLDIYIIYAHIFSALTVIFVISFSNSGPQITVIKYLLHLIYLWGSPSCLWAMPTKAHSPYKIRKLQISRYVWHSSCFQFTQHYCESCPTYQAHSVRRARKIKRETQLSQVNYTQAKWYQYECIYTNVYFCCWIEAESCSCTKTGGITVSKFIFETHFISKFR